MNKLLLTFCLLLFGTLAIVAQTSLEGKVKDKESGEPVLFATVALYKNGVLTTGVETDLDGNYFFSDIQPGTYDVEASYVGYKTSRINGVVCKAGQNTRVNIDMIVEGVLVDEIVVVDYRVPLIEVDNTSQGATITSDKIATLPQKNINAIVANAAGVSSADGSQPSLRGSRSNETVYFIDGIRSRGTIPQSEVDQLQLVNGGIEAKYGDVSGGVISLTSKGPSQSFTGGIEAETSEGLDAFGYNLLSANFSGPILKNSKKQTILGFRFSGQYLNVDDNSPSAVGVSRAPLSVIQQLEASPFYNLGTSLLPSAERLRTADVGGVLKARPNETNKNLNITGKIEAKLSNNIDMTLSGNYEDDNDRFTPGSSSVSNSGSSWAFYNWNNNPFALEQKMRINFRFRHKLGRQAGIDDAGGEKEVNNSLIRNLSYTILAGYERSNTSQEDYRHKDNFFNYGYMGVYPSTFEPAIGLVDDGNGGVVRSHLGFQRITGDFVPNTTINPVLAMYQNASNGIMRSDRSSVWSNLFANVGQVYNVYSKGENELYTFNFSTGFDLVPGSSEKGRHSIQFGVIYEQTVDRGYVLRPYELWRNADLLVNNPLSLAEVDKTAFKEVNAQGDSIFYPVYEEDLQNKFFYKIREKLNVNLKDFVNVHSLSPDQLSLDMFSAKELADLNIVDYRGYDYLGNKTTGNISFEDFFSEKDADGRRTFPVSPFSPIYAAGYIQDKFTYKDIIFRLGLRADYYDANTKVFKDPYALYEIEDASSYFGRNQDKTQPVSVADDYKVYVAGAESDEIIGYRKGDQWYQPNGTAVSGGNVIFNGGVVYPRYVDRENRVLDIQDVNYKPEYSFDDYKPQLNLMPRMAFSFPISDGANFFTHYDVLYQRPPSNSVLTALDYYYFNNAGSSGVQNNPNLRPVRTVSYEAGFQQKVSQFAAIKMSAYYKENKDLIQRRVYTNVPAPITTYETYGNLDFGTTKGFSFQFDKRRTNNLEFSATYTLQFAEGSGSDANSSGGINTRGILRNLNPLSFDERHRITANIDYRYESGKAYDGPKIAGLDILSNTGINLNVIAVSGQPFTRNSNPAPLGGNGFLGSINGSRQPWTFSMDMRIDKSFTINTSKTSNKGVEGNIYLRVQNVLDARNVRGVFGYTGDPENDGYLLSEFGQDRISDIQASGKDVDAFLDAYSWRLVSPGNYFFPRRIYLGVIFNY
ncbi:MAG: TonB-dependent receptor [Saprospiraceae bacterium]|nr:TonB-dependent receptor [Saprospiraceae bacterium]